MAEPDHLNRLGHLLWEVSTHSTLMADATIAESGARLTMAATGILDAVADRPGVTAAEIARSTPKTPQAVNQVAGRLEKLGLLERRLAEGRGVGLHITPAGEKARAEGNVVERAVDAQLRDLLGADLYERLRDDLQAARRAFVARGRVEPDAKFR